MIGKFYLPLFLLLASLLGGCATGPAKIAEEERLFFPPPPVEPKVEFMAVYKDQHTFPKSDAQRRLESFFGKTPSEGFDRPLDVVSNGEGLMYVSDPDSRNVWLYDLVAHTIRPIDRMGEGVFGLPLGLALDSDKRLYVADRFKKKVLVFGGNLQPLHSFGGAEGELDAPVGIAVDSERDRVYVSDVRKHTINVYNRKGKHIATLGKRGSGDGEFNFPVDVDVAADGRVVVADMMNARIQIFDASGKFLLKFGKRGDTIDSFDVIKGVAVGGLGHVYVTDAGSNSVKIYDMDGVLLLVMGGTHHATKGVAPGGFGMVGGISVDKKNGIFVADQFNKVVQRFQYLDDEYLEAYPLPGYKEGGAEKGAADEAAR